jgi:hypothetical protein
VGGPEPFFRSVETQPTSLHAASIVGALGTTPLATPTLLRDAAERLVDLSGEGEDDARRAPLSMLSEFYTACFRAVSTWSPSLIDLKLPDDGRDLSGVADLDIAEHAEVIGSADDLEQLFVARGSVLLPTRVQLGGVVKGSYLDGIAAADYALAARGAVASLAAKKLVTPAAGALTRALVTVGYEERIVEVCGRGDSAHTVLDCTGDFPCSVAYGPDRETGGPIAVGRRVGILAAMAIGERSTQLALKSIHQRSQAAGSLFHVVKQVRNELVLLERMPAGAQVPDDDNLKARLLTRADVVGELLSGKLSVDPVHVLVLLRVHLRALRRRREEGENAETSRQPRALSAFSRAVLEGSLTPLLVPAKAVEFDGAEQSELAESVFAPHLVSLISGRVGR